MIILLPELFPEVNNDFGSTKQAFLNSTASERLILELKLCSSYRTQHRSSRRSAFLPSLLRTLPPVFEGFGLYCIPKEYTAIIMTVAKMNPRHRDIVSCQC